MGVLDQTTRRQLMDLLEAMTVLDSREGRDMMLRDLPPALLDSIERSDATRVDLDHIVETCVRWVPDAGPPPLLLVLDSACDLIQGSQMAEQLQAVRDHLAAQPLDLAGPPGPVRIIVPPTGTVTFLLTAIEGSTTLWERYPAEMEAALARHNAVLRQATEAAGGYVVKIMGDGFHAAFTLAADALGATLAGQRALHTEPWPTPPGPLRVRMALHTGAAEERDGDYFGPVINRAAHLMDAGHGGQVLLSRATQELVRDALPPGAALRDLGEQHLKDLIRPEQVHQLVVPDLPAEFPPLKTLNARPNNLPRQATPFIGRERELAAVAALIRRSEVALVTLTGPGGMGKTRLSLQVAADLLDDFPDGVWFVELAPISDPDLVVPTIAQALGVEEGGGTPLVATLKTHLREKHLLLVLDNFEQVVSAAPLLRALLQAAPRLEILVSSRVALRITGENEFAVAPLALPDRRHLPPLEQLTQYAAVRLFIDRAQAVRADFQVTSENAPAVAEICARLDGMPLAIELAAARIKLLPPVTLLARLESRLGLLTGGGRDRTARQQTLRGAIAWSYDLLDASEQQLFRRLAVFQGGRTLEASEAICGGVGDEEWGLADQENPTSIPQPLTPLDIDLLDGLASLVDKSLVQQQEGLGGEARFVMLETIHEFARERLAESGEAEHLHRRHAAFFLALAEAGAGQAGPEQAARLARLEEEHDNLGAVFTWAEERGDAALMLRLAGTLTDFWQGRGHLSEGRRRLATGLAQGDAVAPAVRARAFSGAGSLAADQGDLAAARAALEAALALWRELGDQRQTAGQLRALGIVALRGGDYTAARTYYGESLALMRSAGDQRGIAYALLGLAAVAGELGDYDQARSFYQASLDLTRQLGDATGIAIILCNLGVVVQYQGDYAAARQLYEDGLRLFRELDHKLGIAWGIASLGSVALDQGDYAAARASLREGLREYWQLGNRRNVAENLEALAGLAGGTGQPERAARLYGAAEALREAIAAPLPRGGRQSYERHLAAARAGADPAAWATAWAAGRAMPIAEAVADALEETTAPGS